MKQDGGAVTILLLCFLSSKMRIKPFHEVNITSNQTIWKVLVIFQKRVRVFHRGFKHEKTDESTRPQAECFYCFRVFETPMKHEARVFEITSPTKEN